MKTENKLKYKVIMYLLMFLCAICISFHLTIYSVQSVQEVKDSQLASVNNECNNSGDGNNNSLIDKTICNIFSHINSNNKFKLPYFVAFTFGAIILFIQNRELYFIKQDNHSGIIKRSLIAQKIRLNN